MDRIILFFLFAFFCNVTPLPLEQIQSEQEKLRFTAINSPTVRNLNKIKLFSPERGIVVGGYLIDYSTNEFRIHEASKKINDFWNVAANERMSVLERKVFPFSFSELYLFEKNRLRKLPHPFGNEIVSISITEKHTIWIGGDRELAYYKTGKWFLMPYPKTNWAVVNIYGDDNRHVWVKTINDKKLFFFDGNNWIRHLTNENVRHINFQNIANGLALTSESVYGYKNGKWHKITSDPIIRKIEQINVDTDGNIWGIGNSGFLAKYILKKWIVYETGTKENLNDIAFKSSSEGFIVGDNGLIIFFSGEKPVVQSQTSKGFRQINPIPSYANIDEQYGVVIDDFDGDNKKDVYAISLYHSNQFYRNISKTNHSYNDQYFKEEAFERNLTGFTGAETSQYQISKVKHGIAAADFDNDGDQDIYITNLSGVNSLFINNGDGVFREAKFPTSRGLGKNERTNSASFSDVDNDGDLDLFITNEYTTNRLFMNDGYGFFTEVTEVAGLATDGGSICAAFADLDNDGLQDLFVTNWGRPNLLYKNESSKGKISFRNVSSFSGISDDLTNKSNAITFGDINNDGLLDLFVSRRGQLNQLFINLGDLKFDNRAAKYFGAEPMLSYGACFADYDNDGYLDLYLSNVGENILYKNISGKQFVDITIQNGAELSGYCTGSASGDIDDDGDIDLYSSVFAGGSSKFLANQLNNKSFIKINLKGTISNRDAIGAKVSLYRDGDKSLVGYREVFSTTGYASQSTREIHFGIDPQYCYFAIVQFPTSGITKKITQIKAGSTLEVFEQDGQERYITATKQFLISIIRNRENQIAIMEYCAAFLICAYSFNRFKRKYEWLNKRNIILHILLILSFGLVRMLFDNLSITLEIILPIVILAFAVFVFHLFYERIIISKKIKDERKRTRDQIARDLHDNLASTIGSGLIYADSLTRKLDNESSKQTSLAQIVSDLLHEASESITDLVWTVSPLHDSLKDLIARLRYYITTNAQSKNIEYEVNINVDDTNRTITDIVKKNVFLIVKEGFHNLLKHSEATKLEFNVHEQGDFIFCKLHDNGKGFNNWETLLNCDDSHGNGIGNMLKRAEEIGGELKITSSIGKGTLLSLKIPK